MERLYLHITEKVLFGTLWRWEIRSYFELSMILLDLGKMLFCAVSTADVSLVKRFSVKLTKALVFLEIYKMFCTLILQNFYTL